ncbi:MAG TPA: hypothetical protein VHR45_07770 [Thermoanaerobaculia bacterium]|nr:hypothetical protein [Thermoanaerobaculia bacterium]
MSAPQRSKAIWVCAGVLVGLLLHGGFGLLAQAIITHTTSTSSGTSFESPPACSPVGSSRVVETVAIENTIGPATIIIGNRDTGGEPFEVLAGTTNINVNTHRQTFQCVAAVAAVPVLSRSGILGLAGLLGGLGAWRLAGRRTTTE